ncbi:uncharacterized protein LOC143432239 [Xylocopa sonorina]|uniref:uncharacterized protein LOC143432239 n=1 Tax=Xylocopa sonorina TaxID=1818115 RepID=UPI00403B05E2
MPLGVHLTCYADDTLVLAIETNRKRAICRAEIAVAAVAKKMEELGLQMAPEKTEILCFEGKRRDPSGGKEMVTIGPTQVKVGSEMSYFGVLLDDKWTFDRHFARQAVRLDAAANYLSRIMPNMNGPDEKVRKLYAAVVKSIALYGTPVWSDALCRGRRSLQLLRSAWRRIAICVVRGYRTIFYDAATLLAGLVPLEYLAQEDQTAPTRDELRKEARRFTFSKWKEKLAPASAHRAVGAIIPILEKWVEERKGQLTFRSTQVLMGHGCFAQYLQKIGKEATATCFHCGEQEDTAQHILEFCPVWKTLRHALVAEIDLWLRRKTPSVKGSVRSLLDESYVVGIVDVCHVSLQGRGLSLLRGESRSKVPTGERNFVATVHLLATGEKIITEETKEEKETTQADSIQLRIDKFRNWNSRAEENNIKKKRTTLGYPPSRRVTTGGHKQGPSSERGTRKIWVKHVPLNARLDEGIDRGGCGRSLLKGRAQKERI